MRNWKQSIMERMKFVIIMIIITLLVLVVMKAMVIPGQALEIISLMLLKDNTLYAFNEIH